MQETNFTNASENELLKLAQGGNGSAFGELFRRNHRWCLKVAMSILKERQDAEDALQDAYCSAWRHIAEFHGDSKFSTWMSRIVTNHCFMRLRKAKRMDLLYIEDRPSTDSGTARLDLPEPRKGPEAELGSKEITHIVRREIRKLPTTFRTILKMRYIDELPMQDLADRTGISVLAAKSRLMRARTELKRRLEFLVAAPAPSEALR